MKNMEEWFAAQDFNKEELPSGHRNRFLEKLEKAEGTLHAEDEEPLPKTAHSYKDDSTQKGRVISMTTWVKWSLVAGLAFILGISGLNLIQTAPQPEGLESVSPEMAQAQDFFTSTINLELERLNKAQSPQTERIIADTKTGLKKLEVEYIEIKKDFKVNKNSKAVIAAMIQNFQSRISLLETAQAQIEQLNRLKENDNENLL